MFSPVKASAELRRFYVRCEVEVGVLILILV